MPARLDRRRFLLAVTTGNPALVRRSAPRRGSAAAAADTPGDDRPFGQTASALSTRSAAVTCTYDASAATPKSVPVGPGTLGWQSAAGCGAPALAQAQR